MEIAVTLKVTVFLAGGYGRCGCVNGKQPGKKPRDGDASGRRLETSPFFEISSPYLAAAQDGARPVNSYFSCRKLS